MRITLTRRLAGHDAGATIERGTKVAQLLIAHGAAVEAEQSAPKATAKAAKPRKTSGGNGQAVGKTAGQSVAADKPAGQRGGGVPPPSPSPTAG